MFDLKKFYKDGIISGLRSGELSRAEATLKYVKPFLGDETFTEADAAEIAAVMDELDGGVEEPEIAPVKATEGMNADAPAEASAEAPAKDKENAE